MVKLLSESEKQSLHSIYRNKDLYRQWAGILCQLERAQKEMDAVTLWLCAEKCLKRLQTVNEFRDEEIPFIYNDLLDQCQSFTKGKEIIHRSSEEAERSAITIMCVVLSMLMNVVEKEHENEDFNYKPICVAIDRVLQHNAYYTVLIKSFFDRSTWNNGQEVIIEPSDPMADKEFLKHISKEERDDSQDSWHDDNNELSDLTIPEKAFNAKTDAPCFTNTQMGILLQAVAELTENPVPGKTTLGEVVERISGYSAKTVNQNMKGKHRPSDIVAVASAIESRFPKLAAKVRKL